MNLVGQKDQSSPFTNSLEDDRLGPASKDHYIATSSICTPFEHLQFHLDMTNAQYLMPSTHQQPKRLRVHGLTLPDTAACVSGPHTAAYSPPELAPFTVSGISSFNYPATVDTTLLTPISGSESPPLDQMSSPKMEHYHSSQSAMPLNEVPTPPNTGRLTQQPHLTVHGSPMHHRMASNGQAPLLTHPNPTQYRPPSTPKIVGFEELRGDPALFLPLYPAHTPTIAPSKRKRQEKSKSSKPGKTSSISKESPHPGYIDGPAANQDEKGVEEELTLHDDAPDDDKFLFQLRKEHISEKGKGMWEEMKAKYSEKHQGNWEKAALQMKVSRAVAKFGVWPEQEIQRLKEAFFQDEEKRYQRLIAHMKEKGGCKVWDWKPQHISAMLIKLGLEDAKVEEKTGIRRRKKLEKRKHTSPALHGGTAYSTPHFQHQNMVAGWSEGSVGLGLRHVFPDNHSQQQPLMNTISTSQQPSHGQSFYELTSDEKFPQLTSEQLYETIDQMYNVAEDEMSSPAFTDVADSDERAGNAATSSAHTSRPPTRDALNVYRKPSTAKLAQQACEQLLQGRQQ
ncbi:hypothetical protein NEUTE1DRAFT_125320 [Neurospora tetrasperma FGSC 2508]|uniref:Uncharacterized protein n=1 Tax=Neurospora tetrasperma (strain FGSC 2508 / ATCC MYA-4615 / P0657) TaxID=510951 RepID=F8N2I1_NEUT8|nr:uncharacterized protein NEUTE1DRAFT_125320 [Neurospora tetrasperma FGSC 2508]EGO51653.1 hypothetical protein NEUTE1DRAFT_125320 [Neurospora tetrasperma FGSC 2508]